MSESPTNDLRPKVIAVVIPCYRVSRSITDVIRRIGPEVELIVCVDDCCPEGTADVIRRAFSSDLRIKVVRHEKNTGVGGATCTGYREAIKAGADVIVKIDGDGQMDPSLIPYFSTPIANGEFDYAKGNRFFEVETVRNMPAARLIGNAVLSFMTKLSSGYWDLFDPSNGYTAIASGVAKALPLEKLHKRYFFEADMLFRLGVIRARITELPMAAIYGTETSSLNEVNAAATFPFLHLRNTLKRIIYSYFIRGFSIASVNLILGFALLVFGAIFGAVSWHGASISGIAATPGTVMLSALPILSGIQFLLAFLAHDMSNVPNLSIQNKLYAVTKAGAESQEENN